MAERPRRHRRVVAPPTNPAADQSDDVPTQRRAGANPRDARAGRTEPVRTDARDAWIQEQRPPHWD